ncbi:hypothetical protein NLU13_4813 [Sarocladium strictum]|uniref:Clr5 domain-containing protein n=1 Tax=Sarocladium strictum TaxID=5046 RepID=A0AA39GJK8_SARSR|nr:hypothetical protein NLU13_4813 [Sarocladium strictum]
MAESSQAKPKSQEEWEQCKDTIINLFNSGMKLPKLMKEMVDAHGFHATTTQYRTQLYNRWKLPAPNIPKDRAQNEWLRTSRVIKKRERIGKKSQVMMDGKVLDQRRVTKEMTRYDSYLHGPLRQNTPQLTAYDILSVVTPPPMLDLIPSPMSTPLDLEPEVFDLPSSFPHLRPVLNLKWPSAMPIFEFDAETLPQLSLNWPTSELSQFMSNLSEPCSNAVVNIASQPTAPGLDLQIILRSDSLQGVPSLVDKLLRILPERTPGDHFRTETLIEHGSQSILQFIRIWMYVLANHSDDDELCPSDDDMLRALASAQNQWLRQLYMSDDPNLTCLSETFFASAVREGDIAACARLLEAGADPQQIVDISFTELYGMTEGILPLELDYDDLDVCSWRMPVKHIALGTGNCQLASMLLERVVPKDWMLGGWPRHMLWVLFILGAHLLWNRGGEASDMKELYRLLLRAYSPSGSELFDALWTSMRFNDIDGPVALATRTLWNIIRFQGHHTNPSFSQQALAAAILMQDNDVATSVEMVSVSLADFADRKGCGPLDVALVWCTQENELEQLGTIRRLLERGANLKTYHTLDNQDYGHVGDAIRRGLTNVSSTGNPFLGPGTFFLEEQRAYRQVVG